MRGYQYLAAPYSHPDPQVRLARVVKCATAVANMMKNGGLPFSPLVHGYWTEQGAAVELPWELWMEHSFAMLGKAQACYVLTLEGWGLSKGVKAEIEFAKRHAIPLSYAPADKWCTPGYIPQGKWVWTEDEIQEVTGL
jgi:hypothetical protein